LSSVSCVSQVNKKQSLYSKAHLAAIINWGQGEENIIGKQSKLHRI